MDDLNLTAEELRDFRRVLGWSQQKLADELAVARNTVVRMENGQMAVERRTALAVRYLAWHYNKIEKVTNRETVQQHREPVPQTPLERAWAVHAPELSRKQGFEKLRENLFELAKIDVSLVDSVANYDFWLRVILHLEQHHSGGQIPMEWCHYSMLRDYVLNEQDSFWLKHHA